MRVVDVELVAGGCVVCGESEATDSVGSEVTATKDVLEPCGEVLAEHPTETRPAVTTRQKRVAENLNTASTISPNRLVLSLLSVKSSLQFPHGCICKFRTGEC